MFRLNLGCGTLGGAPSTLQPSMLIAPVPYRVTFAATVPTRGFRATITGSHAGFSAVPHPDHCCASAVAGAVTSRSFVALPLSPSACSIPKVLPDPMPAVFCPITARSAPAARSIAFDTSSDFGKPDPYSQHTTSRISHPASSIATVSR